MGMTFVKVERHPYGITQFSGCTAEISEDDTVTVTCTEDGRVMQTFAPGTWRSTVVLSDKGMPLYAYVSRIQQEEMAHDVQHALAAVRSRKRR